ncbi:type I polyketide synthase [Pseudoalteromonas sp. KG3]|nr:type I polyketide synthase [Pseudoalteromonas sp. KG3]WKD25583.1 type I polyketide synthase [Pseudoalteromonas sp. KG3]
MTISDSINDSDIAVIGLACRFPGAQTVEKFWDNLKGGVESITTFSDEELKKAGVSPTVLARPDYVKSGSILEDIDKFDANFFGFSPKEAQTTDPQQRIFLECAWEAIEDAGYSANKDEYSIGVYAGAGMTSYFFERVSAELPFLEAEAFSALLGNDKDYLATHASYKLNLKGPGVSIQTACSTSLVATHMACQSLINGECDIALAGGVSVRTPHKSGYFYHEAMMLAPDGHCRAFDVDSQGTVPGNGAGVVALKRLDDALADGDTIYAVIKGSAINNDGAGKVGFTAPSVEGQAAVISEAQAIASIDPETISYVEAHGTGTKLGDPIEIAALTKAFYFGTDKKGFCPIGTVKSNFGHLDAAAGIAGLIKTVLALKHKQIPPSLHFNKANPSIDFSNTPFYVNTVLMPWQSGKVPRRAGVSSFGMGGTNAHVVLEEAPTMDARSQNRHIERPLHLLTLSGKTTNALRQQAHNLARHLKDYPSASLADVCYTAATKRHHFEHRLSLTAGTYEEALQQLECRHYLTAKAREKAPKLAFLFSGQGSQYLAMGKTLFETQPLFRAELEQCDVVLRDLDVPLLDLLYGEKSNTETLNQTMNTQPALFAIEYALAKLWLSWGVRPTVLMGHSVGEYVAACIAGVFSLEDGLKLITARGRLMQCLCSRGDMVALPVNEAKAQELIAPFADLISLAAINGPENTVVSGESQSMARFVKGLAEHGIQSKALSVSHAFHSVMMEPMLDEFAKVARTIRFDKPKIPICSNVTGKMLTEELLSPDYWVRHVRQPVRFSSGIETLQTHGVSAFLEIGPKPILLSMAEQLLVNDVDHIYLPSLREALDDWQPLLESLGRWHIHGGEVDWQRFDEGYGRSKVSLPLYPFQRQRYWMPPLSTVTDIIQDSSVHPLLGQQLQLADTDKIRFANNMGAKTVPWLVSHHVFGSAVLPATGYLEMAFSAGMACQDMQNPKSSSLILQDISFEQALILSEHDTSSLQLVMSKVGATSDEGQNFQIFSQDEHSQWISHVRGTLVARQANSQPQPINLEQLLSECLGVLSVTELYALWKARGLHFGSDFQALEQVQQGEGLAIGKVTLPESLLGGDTSLDTQGRRIHPAMLDLCLQVMFVNMFDPADKTDKVWLPVSMKKVQVYGAANNTLWSVVKVVDTAEVSLDTQSLTLNILVCDDAGKVVASIEGLTAVRIAGKTLRSHFGKEIEDFYELNWVPSSEPAIQEQKTGTGHWLVFADRSGEGEALAASLQQQGDSCTLVYNQSASNDENVKGDYSTLNCREIYHIDPNKLSDFEQLFEQLNESKREPLKGVVHLWSLDVLQVPELTLEALSQAQKLICGSVLHLLRTFSDLQHAKLWLVTRHAVNLSGEISELAVCQAPLWGLAKVISQEYPKFWGGIIDGPSQCDLLREITVFASCDKTEDHIAYQDDRRYVARMQKSPTLPQQGKVELSADKSYLITGGLGKLGLHLARWLVEKGACNIALVGRSTPSDYAQAEIAKLQHLGANILVIKADVANPADVSRVFHQINLDMPTLKGIIHAAGVIDRKALHHQSWSQFSQGMAAKVEGSWNLHHHTQSLPLDFFVLFSSSAAHLGGLNMASYAAGNAFIDALAQYRYQQGLTALSINWSFWADGGMSDSIEAEDSLSKFMMSTDHGLSTLESLLSNPQQGRAFVFPGGLATFLADFYPGEIPAFLLELDQKDSQDASAMTIKHQLEQASWRHHDEILERFIREKLGSVLKLSPAQIDSQQPLNSMGLDSLMTVGLGNHIRSELGVDIAITTLMGDGTTLLDLLAELNPLHDRNSKPQDALKEGEKEFKI